jgi:alkylation response protein AidB-like acyl-CoA dehydrogenase
MDFGFSEETELLIENLTEWLNRNMPESEIRKWYYEDHMIPDAITKDYMDNFGFIGIPEEYGGTPVDLQTLGLMAECVGRQCGAMVPFQSSMLVMYDLIHWGNEDQVRKCMEVYKSTGRSPVSLAFSEPEAGSDSMNISTTVKEKDGKFIMNGAKTWVSFGALAPMMLITAKDEDPTSKSVSMWMIDSNAPGVSTSPIAEIGVNFMPFVDVYLNDVELTEANLVGERGKGFYLLMKNFEMERALGVASGIGMAQGCLDDAGAFVNERITFGKPISSYQLIQEKLCDMETKIINMRNLLYYALWRLEQGLDVRIESSLLKRYAAIETTNVCNDAMQIFGGLGYTLDKRAARCWIDSRGTQFGGGTNEIMVHIAGRQLAKKYVK